MEAQLSAHIRHLLLDYVQCHITTDYVQFTEAAVAELVSLEQISEYDPASLTLPSDPYATLSQIHNLENLSPLREKFTTTQDALQLLRRSIGLPEGQIKSECLSWGRDPWDKYQDDAFYRVESILTRRAVRETPVLGKSGGAHQATGMQKVELDSYARLMASKPIAIEPVDVEPVQEHQVKLNQVLDVVYNLKAADHAAVCAYLQSTATMCRPHVATPNDIRKDYRRAYLPAGFVFDPPRPATPPLDSPPLTPIFARNERLKCVERQNVKNGVLRSYAELPEHLGTLDEIKLHDPDSDMDLARANMIVVDGWQTYAVSSPSTVSSVNDEEFDELAEMFPCSPDTSVVDAMNLVEDIENSKLDEVEIPKNRRIGGSLGLPRESIVDEARKAGGLGAFLAPLLKPSDSNCEKNSASILHPLLYDKMSTWPRRGSGDEKREGRDDSDSKISERDLDSVYGQASAVGESIATEEDNEIRGLYLDLSRSGEKRLGPPLPRELPDPKALIRDEPLFEEVPKGKEKEGLILNLMQVPLLPDPNIGIERSVVGYSEYLVGGDNTTQGDERDGTAGKNMSPLRFLKNTKGMAPLRVALSWVPFTCATPIPVHAGLLQNDLGVEEAVKKEADALLKNVCVGGDAEAGGCGFGDELRWRKCGGKDEDGNEFSEEIAKCEIILTRKERKALLARERGAVEHKDDIGEGSEDVDDDPSEKRIGLVNERSSKLDGSRIMKASTQALEYREQDENEDDHRLVKRARLSVDDSGIGMMMLRRADGPSYDLNSDQEETLDTTDIMLQDTDHDKNVVAMNRLVADNDDEDIERLTGPIIGPARYDQTDSDVLFADTTDHNSEAIRIEGELSKQSQHGSFGSLTLSNRSYGRYTHPSVAQFDFAEDRDTMFYQGQLSTDTILAEDRDHGKMDCIPRHVVAIENNQHVTPYDGDNNQLKSFKNLELVSNPLGIEAFAKLRAKTIMVDAAPITDKPIETVNTQKRDELLPRMLSRITPTELYDDKTVRIPSDFPQSRTMHKYMASLDLLQKQVLVRSLVSQECLVELVERDFLGGVDLIIDPHTSIIFTCLLSLPARCTKLLERISAQSWRYKRVLIVFEAYPESRSFRQRQKQGLAGPEPDLNAYTPPIVKAIKKFRRDLAIAEGCGKKSITCDVWYAFANSVTEAATYARLFGDEAERADWTGGALWGDRTWLDADESEDEKILASIRGMNCISAAIVLCQMTLQQFLDITPKDRFAMVAPLIGNEAITAFNLEIDERMRVMYEDTTASVMSCA